MFDDDYLVWNVGERLSDALLQCHALAQLGVSLVHMHMQARMPFSGMGNGPRNRDLVDCLSLIRVKSPFVHGYSVNLTGLVRNSFQEAPDRSRLRLCRLQFTDRVLPMQAAASTSHVQLDGAAGRGDQHGDDEIVAAVCRRGGAGFIKKS